MVGNCVPINQDLFEGYFLINKCAQLMMMGTLLLGCYNVAGGHIYYVLFLIISV